MTRGFRVAPQRPQVRGKQNPLILHSEGGRGRIGNAPLRGGKTRFAHGVEFVPMNHRFARDQTPGPQGSGED